MSEPIDIVELKKVLHEVFDGNVIVDKETHSDHHEWIKSQIRKEKRRQEMWVKIKTQVIGWGIIAIAGSIGAWVIRHVKMDM